MATLDDPGFFTSYEKDGRLISFFGDNHPVYAGSVVKAMASAKDGFPHIARLFERDLQPAVPVDRVEIEARWQALTTHQPSPRRLDEGARAHRGAH